MNVAEVNEVVISGDDCKNETVGKSLPKNLNGTIGYLTLDAKWAFTQLRQVFTKAPIFRHFNPECHI